MSPFLVVALLIVVLTLIFSITNGIHDSSSTVATMIACGASTPRTAVIFSAIVGFTGAMLGGTAVALTVMSLIQIAPGNTLLFILLATVITSVLWNLLTWRFGLPSSSTHALVGGLIGASIASSGIGSVVWGISQLLSSNPQLTGVLKVVVFLLLSVLVGFIGGFLIKRLSMFLLRNAHRSANRPIRHVQYLTAGAVSFSHGSNDAQKQMGIIALALFSAGLTSALVIPLWVTFLCALMLGIGTLGGGWRIMKTLGRKIYPIKPVDSLDSQVSSAASIFGSTFLGAPVSSTQVVSSSILGIGAAENAKQVQWSVGKSMMISWFITIPACMLLSAFFYLLIVLL